MVHQTNIRATNFLLLFMVPFLRFKSFSAALFPTADPNGQYFRHKKIF